MDNINPMSELEVCKVALNHGVVKFVFTKKDGSERVAIGTRNPDILSAVGGTPKGATEDRKEQNPLIYCFFDLVKGAWRCFRTDLFGHILYENMSKEQTAKEILREARSNGEDEVGRMMASKFVPQDIVGKMFTAILDGCTDDEIDLRLHSAPASAPSSSHAPTSSYAPIHHVSLDDRNELIEELLSLRERESEILRVLLQ